MVVVVEDFIVVLFWASSAAQQTLKTIFILLVEHLPPIRRCRSSLDEVAEKNETFERPRIRFYFVCTVIK